MTRFHMILIIVVLVIATFSAQAARAEDVRASGRASMTYEGLVSAVTQEREFDLRVHRDDGQVVSAPVQIKGPTALRAETWATSTGRYRATR